MDSMLNLDIYKKTKFNMKNIKLLKRLGIQLSSNNRTTNCKVLILVLIFTLMNLSINAKTTYAIGGNVDLALSKCAINDTILISSGTYSLTSTINKPCTIIGLGTVVYDGGNRAANKIAFNITSNNVKLKNITIKNYGYGVNIPGSTGCVIENVDISSTGDINNAYSGRGIQLGSYGSTVANSNTVTSCKVHNSAAEGLTVNGNFNSINNCTVTCNENTAHAATDYYLTINGSYNVVYGCYVERIGNLSHYGHGIGMKGNCQKNTIINCTVLNCSDSFFVRHRGAKYNTFMDCKVLYSIGGAYAIRDGASYNTFVNCSDSLGHSSIRFFDTTEDGGATFCGRHNIFTNCSFKNKVIGVFFDSYNVASIADSNYICNSKFENISYLFTANRENKVNELINCKVVNLKFYKSGSQLLNVIYSDSLSTFKK
jgi:hypothetical protein